MGSTHNEPRCNNAKFKLMDNLTLTALLIVTFLFGLVVGLMF